MNILKSIIDNGGYITKHDVAELAKDFPNLSVIVKWESAPRSNHKISDVAEVIRCAEANGNYTREVFISANAIDRLRVALGEPAQF